MTSPRGGTFPAMGVVGWVLLGWIAVNAALPLLVVGLRRLRRLVRDQPLAGELPLRLGESDVAGGQDHVGLDELVLR